MEIIANAWNNKTGFGILVCAPTYRLVDSVLERPIVAKLKEMGLLKSHSFSRHETTLQNGNTIYFRSLEEPDNALRGLNICAAYVDEAAYCSKYSIDVVKGRLLTTNGRLILISTPNGQNSWMYDEYIAEPKESVEYIQFNLRDNPIISEEAIQRLYESYDPLLAQQELEGKWVNLFENQVYYSFGDENIGDYPHSPGEQIFIGLDFNLDKNAWCGFQRMHNHTFKMIYEGFGAKTTADMAKQIIDKFGKDVIIVPDMTGKNRLQGTATTHFQLLRQAGLNKIIENPTNPSRLKRYAVVNATLKNALGEHRLFIDRSCKETIKELRELSFKEGTDKPDSKGEKTGHRTDAFGYVIIYLTQNTVGRVINNTDDFVADFKARKLAMETFTF